MSKKQYTRPTLELFEFEVEHGFAGSLTRDTIDIIDNGGCNCKGENCCCSSRSECRGSGINGCQPKRNNGSIWY